MKRLLRAHSTFLTVLFLAASCFAALIVLLLADSPANAAQSTSNLTRAPALPVVGFVPKAIPLLGSPGVITCTQTYTTLADPIGGETGNDFVNAASIAPYQDLSLVGTVGIDQSKKVFTETFRLDNPKTGTKYKIEAIPYQTSNYNLGITLYDHNRQVVNVTGNPDENSTNYKASIEFVANGAALYYFIKVYQITQQCFGGTYDLSFSYTDATPTPTPTVTPSPDYPDIYDTPPNNNDTINAAAFLFQYQVTGLTLYNAVLYPSSPGDDQDWFIIPATLAGYQYVVSAAPDNIYPAFNMQVYGPDRPILIAQVLGASNPTIGWFAPNTGYYFVRLWRASGSPTSGTYHLNWSAWPNFVVYLPIILK